MKEQARNVLLQIGKTITTPCYDHFRYCETETQYLAVIYSSAGFSSVRYRVFL